ncbi:hypothetical protein FH972_006099 [Carpinus fangiana]|uniref:Uncharacterized protein n=1 Tax=Carpinus fangiana TaxID=176857 RepID=A0A5N6QR92_9ROSI|nr:hypothetical protein FH972_006099 [Carpinus fangiana]
MTVRQLIMSHVSLKYRAPRVTPMTMVTSRSLCMPRRPSAAPWTAPHTPPKAATHVPPLPAASPFVVVLDDMLEINGFSLGCLLNQKLHQLGMGRKLLGLLSAMAEWARWGDFFCSLVQFCFTE